MTALLRIPLAVFAIATVAVVEPLAEPVPRGMDAGRELAQLAEDAPDESEFAIPNDEIPTLRTYRAPAPEPFADLPSEPPAIITDLDAIPVPVRRMRELILNAVATGDIERLRSLVGRGEAATILSVTEQPEDPIAYLKAASGDPEGHEIMAILQEILEAPFVRVDRGEDTEAYVWPYFAAYPLDALTPQQKVGLFRIITGGDYEDMQQFGAYIFYRAAISPDGQWRYFVAGD